jgi:hypothetical protein
VAGFVDRNNDTLSEEIRALMLSSNNQLLKGIFGAVAVGDDAAAAATAAAAAAAAQDGRRSASKLQSFLKAASVTQKFKTQLAGLMGVVEGTAVQVGLYLGCIIFIPVRRHVALLPPSPCLSSPSSPSSTPRPRPRPPTVAVRALHQAQRRQEPAHLRPQDGGGAAALRRHDRRRQDQPLGVPVPGHARRLVRRAHWKRSTHAVAL